MLLGCPRLRYLERSIHEASPHVLEVYPAHCLVLSADPSGENDPAQDAVGGVVARQTRYPGLIGGHHVLLDSTPRGADDLDDHMLHNQVPAADRVSSVCSDVGDVDLKEVLARWEMPGSNDSRSGREEDDSD